MIAYDLKCENGHTFEGWFDDADSFTAQQERALVTCPFCSSSNVERMMSTFGIARHRNKDGGDSNATTMLDRVVDYVKEHFEDVGVDFTKEALKMHYGVTEQRNIRGVSSAREEEMLKEEGINYFKLPIPVAPDND
jgi:hypothetical protein